MKKVYISPNNLYEVIPILGEALLLYDHVTLDISLPECLMVIAENIGDQTMQHLVETNVLNFTYPDKQMNICGEDIKTKQKHIFKISKSKKQTILTPESIECQLKKFYSNKTINMVKEITTPVEVKINDINKSLVSDFKNVLYSNQIIEFVRMNFNLPEIFPYYEDDEAITLSINSNDPKLNAILAFIPYIMVQVNFRLSLLPLFDQVLCEDDYERFFIGKLNSVFLNRTYKNYNENFIELSEIHNFPDIKELINRKSLTIDDIIKLRMGDGVILRQWLDKVSYNSMVKNVPFSKECARILANNTRNIPLPIRTVSFGLIQILSAKYFFPGVLAGAADSFLIPKLVNNWQPKLFFDKARKMYWDKAKLEGRKVG